MIAGLRLDWEEVMTQSKASLCPRGFGRSSFRLYEVLSRGLVPVYLYDDVEWLPYRGTKADVATLGIVTRLAGLRAAISRVGAMSPQELGRRHAAIRDVRESHFTLAGLISQMEGFLVEGERGSDLRCRQKPSTAGMYLPALWDNSGGNLGKELALHAWEEPRGALMDALRSSADVQAAMKGKVK